MSSVTPIPARFDVIGAGYDRESLRFASFCADAFVAYLNPKPGAKALDVAAGPVRLRYRSRRQSGLADV